MKRLFYETEPCVRCGGSGWYSYCDLWGHTCFECGVRPKEQGTGRRFTKVAREAQSAVAAFIKERFSRRADAVEPGMWIMPYGRSPELVVGVRNPSGSGRVNPDGSVQYGVDVQTKRICHVFQPEWTVQVVPSGQEWDSVVLPFARTLRGVTVEGDTPVGIYRIVAGRKGRRVEYVTRWGSLAGALAFIGSQGPRVRRRMFVAPVEHDAGRAKSWAA